MMWDAAIIGGGPAGAAVAGMLARAGRSTVLFEREAGPRHKVCGEFISVEASACLTALGLDPERLGALPIRHVRLIQGERTATADLPFPAFSLSRDVMDDALLKAAAASGAEIRSGVTVRGLTERSDGVTLQADEHVRAGAAFLATGKHELRGHRRPPGAINDLIGFKRHLTLAPAQAGILAGHVEVLLFPGGYAGLQPVPGGHANLCLVVEKSVHDRLDRDWDALLGYLARSSTVFAERLAGAEPCWAKPLSIYGIPYGFVHRMAAPSRRLHRVGDQLAVIPSFSGDGIAIALHSAELAAERFLNGQPALDGTGFERQIRIATLLARVACHPILQTFATAACRLSPALLRSMASATRIRGHSAALLQPASAR
jgi:menaquinone-9 beta-reductase